LPRSRERETLINAPIEDKSQGAPTAVPLVDGTTAAKSAVAWAADLVVTPVFVHAVRGP